MRENNYISMMDPFQRKYGKTLTAALAVVPVMAEIVGIPGLLISLGTNTRTHPNALLCTSLDKFSLHFLCHVFATGATMHVILDLPFGVCIWISAAVAIAYTVLGGLYSVAYTDVVQLSLTLLSLVSFTLRRSSKSDFSAQSAR